MRPPNVKHSPFSHCLHVLLHRRCYWWWAWEAFFHYYCLLQFKYHTHTHTHWCTFCTSCVTIQRRILFFHPNHSHFIANSILFRSSSVCSQQVCVVRFFTAMKLNPTRMASFQLNVLLMISTKECTNKCQGKLVNSMYFSMKSILPLPCWTILFFHK